MLKSLIARFPLWVRKFVFTTIVSFVAGLVVMSYAQINEAGINALGVALATAALKSAAENSGLFFAWLSDTFSIDSNPPA